VPTAKSRYQIGKEAVAECRPGKDWKLDCQLVIEGAGRTWNCQFAKISLAAWSPSP